MAVAFEWGLQEQRLRLSPAIDHAVLRVLNHGEYVLGPEVARLEHALRRPDSKEWRAVGISDHLVARPRPDLSAGDRRGDQLLIYVDGRGAWTCGCKRTGPGDCGVPSSDVLQCSYQVGSPTFTYVQRAAEGIHHYAWQACQGQQTRHLRLRDLERLGELILRFEVTPAQAAQNSGLAHKD